ncbi:MAG TPA: hypothetical protein VFG20_00740 [Planctomycetaceae bacterium]|nr:hypothetical protein [Planctomycetaceae bacterium]
MPTTTTPRPLKTASNRACWLAVLFVVVPAIATAAEPFHEPFDAAVPTWKFVDPTASARVLQHARQRDRGRQQGAEHLRLLARKEGSRIRLEHAVPAARVFEEVTARLWIRSDHPGWVLGVVIVLPGITDPETGKPAEITLAGDYYSEAGQWRELRVQTADRLIKQRLVLLRAQLGGAVDPGEMVIDRVVLACPLPNQECELLLDDLRLAPIVAPSSATVQQTSAVIEPAQTVPAVSFRLDRLQTGGQPFFPRLVRHRQESPDALAALGFNTVWIGDYTDTALLTALRKQQLWAAATPPQPQTESGDTLNSQSAGLVPFSASSDAILCWMLGTRVESDERSRLVPWIEQIEMADRRRNRPIAVDVLGEERLFSRDVGWLGSSRHPLQTSFSLIEYRDWLAERRSLARPGAFCWTWVQTEPSPALQALGGEKGAVPVIEPEQIRLQTYAALSAGCKAIGFWTNTPLESDSAIDRERALALQQLNLELGLMEPWLATASGLSRETCTARTPGSVDPVRNAPIGNSLPNNIERAGQLRAHASQQRQRQREAEEISVTVLRTEFGTLVLPMWLEQQSQFVPSQSAAQDVTFTIPGTGETATAWEVSTTEVTSLRSETVAGGRRITLPRLDQTSMIWLTNKPEYKESLVSRVQAIKAPSAAASVELARLKFARVAKVHEALQTLAPSIPDGPQLLGRAKLRLERAESALQARDYHTARLAATESMQALRILQRAHWDEAVHSLSSPVSSPYSLCFQTLPQHWKLVADFGRSRSRGSRNLLPSGEFEDLDTLIAEGWQNEQHVPDELRARAELFPSGRSSRYSLRMACEPAAGVAPPRHLERAAVTFTTPPIPARAGQILHISGWVKIRQPITGHRDGLMIYDSLLGKPGALRFHQAGNWTQFELLREATESTEWTLTMALTGMGDVLIDDLRIMPQEPWPEGTSPSDAPKIEPASGTSGFLDRLPRLPTFSPLPRRDR